MAYIGVSPNAGTVATQIITSANGSATSFTLDQTVPDGQSIIVLVGNVVQQPTHQGIAGAYTASGNTITFTGPPANGDNIIIRYLGRSVDTSTSYKKVIRYRYVATNNQTTFTGADSNGLTLSYTADDIDVFLNGVRLDQTDYTATNGTSVVLGSGATTSDELVILAYNTVQLADTVPASTGGTFTGAVTINGAFTSQGIDDNANATAITISSDEDVSLGAGDLTVSRNEANGTVRLNLSNTGVNGSTEYSELKLNSTAGGTQTSVVQHRNNYGLNVGTTTNHAVYLLQNNANALSVDTSKNVKLPSDASDFTFTTNSLHIGASADIKIGHTNNNNVILSDNGMPFSIYTDVFRCNSADNSESLFGADKNSAFFAKFDNVTKLQTYSQGIQSSGNIRTGNSGDRAIISRAPLTGTTVNNGSTTTVAGINGVLHNIVMVSDGGGSGGCFAMSFNTGVTKLAGSGNYTSSQNTSSSTNIYKSSNSHAVTLQNNSGSDRSYFILVLASYD